MQGDLLFYASSGSFFDNVIAWWTHSKFVHVAIDIGDSHKIEALGQGVVKTDVVVEAIAGRWVYPTTDRDEIAFGKALDWLQSVVGTAYGWNDIAEALDTSHRFLWLQTNHYDCSHLASEFLERSGYDVSKLGNDLARVTPGELANFLGVK